jgi:hypothetical protein
MSLKRNRTVVDVYVDEIQLGTHLNNIEDLEFKYELTKDDLNNEKLQLLIKAYTDFFDSIAISILEHFQTECIIDNDDELRNRVVTYYNMWKAVFLMYYEENDVFGNILDLIKDKELRSITFDKGFRIYELRLIDAYLTLNRANNPTRNIYAIIVDELIKEDKSVEKLLESASRYSVTTA